jgi:hypothetical protein
LLVLDGQVHHDTHPIPMGNYVSEVGNYVSVSHSELGNYVSADIEAAGGSHRHSGRAELLPQKKGPRRRPQLSEVNGTLGTAIQVPGATAIGGSSEVGSVSCPSAGTAAPLG